MGNVELIRVCSGFSYGQIIEVIKTNNDWYCSSIHRKFTFCFEKMFTWHKFPLCCVIFVLFPVMFYDLSDIGVYWSPSLFSAILCLNSASRIQGQVFLPLCNNHACCCVYYALCGECVRGQHPFLSLLKLQGILTLFRRE